MERKWTEPAIKQAFDDFIKLYNRLPTKYEMYKKYNKKFPRPLSVKLTLGITLGQYLQNNYSTYIKQCQSKNYGYMPVEYWASDFAEQYIEYGKPTKDEYNKLRRPRTPNSFTLAKIIGVNTWNEILDYCGLSEKRKELRGELIFEETLEKYQALNEKLQKCIKNIR